MAARNSSSPLTNAALRARPRPTAPLPRRSFVGGGVGSSVPSRSDCSAVSPPFSSLGLLAERLRLAALGCNSSGGVGMPCSSKCFAMVEASTVLILSSPSPGNRPPHRACMRTMRRIVEFHRFLMALSVRPGMSLTMSAHLVPCAATASMMARSSSGLKLSVFTSGHRWLCQRSRHCLPTRLGMPIAIRDQLAGPHWATSSRSLASSSGVHADLVLRPAFADSPTGVSAGVAAEYIGVTGIEPDGVPSVPDTSSSMGAV
mmetsp:Transcript_21215/g.54330  ORF Transcript_21215/g.54330 Transcript_21215/m.54330 type:complete len:259 (-) Transcript_21215:176-952(-)